MKTVSKQAIVALSLFGNACVKYLYMVNAHDLGVLYNSYI